MLNNGVFAVVVLTLNFFLIKPFSFNINFYQIFLFHCFLFGVFVLKKNAHIFLDSKQEKKPLKHLVVNAFALLVCLTFLTPIITSHSSEKKYLIINFFSVYFLYQTNEIIRHFKNIK